MGRGAAVVRARGARRRLAGIERATPQRWRLRRSAAPGRLAQEDSFSVVHGLYWLTAGIAQRAPLLLAVDDLHWADQPSLRFIAHLARRLDGLPVLLVTDRPRAPGRDRAGQGADRGPGGRARRDRAAPGGAEPCRVRGHWSAPRWAVPRRRRSRTPAANSPAATRCCLRALLDSLAAEGIRGHDDGRAAPAPADPGHGLPACAAAARPDARRRLAAARAIAVLGTAATTARAARLAGLDGDTCAEAVGALMAERLIEGEQALRFVHPLVRSAVYQDLASPVRQRWHQRAARMLDAERGAAGGGDRAPAGVGPGRGRLGGRTSCATPRPMRAAAAHPTSPRSACSGRWPNRRRRRAGRGAVRPRPAGNHAGTRLPRPIISAEALRWHARTGRGAARSR